MKVGIITRTNRKGQIVIPKTIRDSLGIDSGVNLNLTIRGDGIYIQPIEEIITKNERESSYLSVLKMTQGAWTDENWRQLRKNRKKIEIAASSRRKKKW